MVLQQTGLRKSLCVKSFILNTVYVFDTLDRRTLCYGEDWARLMHYNIQ